MCDDRSCARRRGAYKGVVLVVRSLQEKHVQMRSSRFLGGSKVEQRTSASGKGRYYGTRSGIGRRQGPPRNSSKGRWSSKCPGVRSTTQKRDTGTGKRWGRPASTAGSRRTANKCQPSTSTGSRTAGTATRHERSTAAWEVLGKSPTTRTSVDGSRTCSFGRDTTSSVCDVPTIVSNSRGLHRV